MDQTKNLYRKLMVSTKEIDAALSEEKQYFRYMEYSALHIACMKENDQIAELLLKNGADPNALDRFNNTCLHLAAAYNQQRIVKMLLDAGANTEFKNADGNTPLNLASYLKRHNIVRLLEPRCCPREPTPASRLEEQDRLPPMMHVSLVTLIIVIFVRNIIMKNEYL